MGLKPHLSLFRRFAAQLKSCAFTHLHQKWSFSPFWRRIPEFANILAEIYLPGLAGAEAGAGFTPSSTEWPPMERW
jgi:hypothetical protein